MVRFTLAAAMIVIGLSWTAVLAAEPIHSLTYNNDIDVTFRLPAGVKVVRGVVVKPADKGVADKQDIWTSAMDSWGFAEMGMMLKDVNRGGGRETRLAKALPDILKQLAEKTGHAELPNLPIVSLGMSKGGGWAAAMCKLNADRAIGYVSVCSWMGGDASKADKSYLQIPGLWIVGSVPDGFKMLPSIDEQYVPAMKQGDVDWTCALSWGAAHDWKFPTTAYCITYLDQSIKLRLPRDADLAAGRAKLNTLAWDDGWAGDRSTWDSPCPAIMAIKDFKGDAGNRVWQPNRYLAYVWRAYMTKSPEITFEGVKPSAPIIVTPAKREYLVETGSSLVVTLGVKAEGVKAVKFYDGDQQIGQADAAPYVLNWVKVPAGNHAIIAVAELADGQQRSSNVLWVVAAAKLDK